MEDLRLDFSLSMKVIVNKRFMRGGETSENKVYSINSVGKDTFHGNAFGSYLSMFYDSS